MKTRTEIINKLFEIYKFQTYLEIGVATPAENFDLINATLKESVDPSPNGKCTYFTTSDDFFLNYAENKTYDVIFVDGLHTTEQAYIDVMNAVKHLNNDGFIIMHDCNPPTEYHIRSYDEFLKTKGAWNGTVFKAFIKLKYELNDWCCFTIDEDWGCGIITKRKILENKQINCNIHNLSWDEFDKNRKELLQLISFNEYSKIIIKDVILKYIIEQFGDNVSKENRTNHYSYCSFPEELCVCEDLNKITNETQLISGGYIDSFSMVVVLIFLEKTFNFKIDDKDAIPENFNCVNKMAELVSNYKK